MKVAEIIEKIIRLISAALFVVLIVVVLLQVMLRYFFSKPLAWSDELARLLLVWTSSLGVTLIFYSKAGHPAVTFGQDRLPARTRLCIEIGKNFGLAVLMLYAGYFGVRYSISTHRFVSAVLHFPMSLEYAVFPLTMGLMAYKGVIDGVEHLNQLKVWRKGGTEP